MEDRGRSSSERGGSRRLFRVEKEMRQAIASYLVGGFRGDLEGLVTVSRVGASADLRAARVFVSVLGTEKEQQATLESLERHVGDVQHEVNRQLRMKHCPRITFALDHGLEKSMKVDSILRALELERAERAASSAPSSADASQAQ